MNTAPGIGLSVLSGVMQGVFPLPMKYVKKWEWENTWCAFTLWGFVVLPWLLAFITVPDLLGVYASVSGTTIAVVTFFGACWGIASICYGVGVNRVGLALASAIVVGTNGALGTLLPMLMFHADSFWTPSGMAITGGVIVMLIGVGVCAVAGGMKQNVLNTKGEETDGPADVRSFRKGILICAFSGITAPMLNFAFVFGSEIVAKAKEAGASPAHASNPIWCWVMTSSFAVTLIYCVYLMSKNRGWNRFVLKDTGYCWVLTLIMGFLWSGGIALYGIALSQLGPLAASIGWPILMICSIISGSICGIATGEWKGAEGKPLRTMIAGLAILAAAILLIGAGNV